MASNAETSAPPTREPGLPRLAWAHGELRISTKNTFLSAFILEEAESRDGIELSVARSLSAPPAPIPGLGEAQSGAAAGESRKDGTSAELSKTGLREQALGPVPTHLEASRPSAVPGEMEPCCQSSDDGDRSPSRNESAFPQAQVGERSPMTCSGTSTNDSMEWTCLAEVPGEDEESGRAPKQSPRHRRGAKARPSKDKRDRLRKLICKLEQKVARDPVYAVLESTRLPPSIAANAPMMEQLRARLHTFALHNTEMHDCSVTEHSSGKGFL